MQRFYFIIALAINHTIQFPKGQAMRQQRQYLLWSTWTKIPNQVGNVLGKNQYISTSTTNTYHSLHTRTFLHTRENGYLIKFCNTYPRRRVSHSTKYRSKKRKGAFPLTKIPNRVRNVATHTRGSGYLNQRSTWTKIPTFVGMTGFLVLFVALLKGTEQGVATAVVS